MSKDEKSQFDPTEDHYDPLTLFLFGNNKKNKEIPIKEKSPYSNNNDSAVHHRTTTSMDQWLFGQRNKEDKEIKEHENDLTDHLQLEGLLKGINVEKLAENIEVMMSTATQLKPLWENITPLINKWIKK